MTHFSRLVFAACVSGASLALHAATPALDAGGAHTVALDSAGAVYAWGDDSSGQLGLGRALLTASAVTVLGISNVAQVSAGEGHVLALMKDGSVRSWGRNNLGQLGDGTTTNRSLPAPVPGLANVIAVRAAATHSVALRSDGTVWTWGVNWQGQLGYADSGDQNLQPKQVPGVSGITAIDSRGEHVLALKNDGTVWAWGRNDLGQLGSGTTDELGRIAPAAVPNVAGIVAIAAGNQHSMAVTGSGAVLTWGYNYSGQLGHNPNSQFRPVPTVVPGITDANAASGGVDHSLVLARDGTVWAWGGGYSGQLGDGKFTPSIIPVKVTGLTNVTQVSGGYYYSAARTSDGSIWAWGQNGSGEIGDGTSEIRGAPVRSINIPAATWLSAGGVHTFIVPADGSVRAWGANDYGELGDGAKPIRATPARVPGATGIEKVAAGGLHTLAVKADGTMLAWGNNSMGQLGNGSQSSRSSPVAVTGITAVREIAAGGLHSVALRTDGSVWTWGYGWQGPLGHGDEQLRTEPTAISGVRAATAIAAGDLHTLILANNGGVLSFGANDRGQLGDGTRTSHSTPAFVNSLTNVIAIAAGESHSLALRSDGTVWAWGSNYSGQLGDGTNTDRLSPVQVAGLTSVTRIAASGSSSYAIRNDGSLWAWGANWTGQLGNESWIEETRPVRLSGMANIASVSGGSTHAVALTTDGAAYAWGFNPDGRIGDGTVASRLSPVIVLRVDGGGSLAANDWFLDLAPAVPTTIPGDRTPSFLIVASRAAAALDVNLRYRAQDVGRPQNVYVFAVAPASRVPTLKGGEPPMVIGRVRRADGAKADEACVLAQLTQSGSLQGVTASTLAAYVGGVLSAQGATVTVLDAATTAAAAGATIFVGYGGSGAGMLGDGTNRSIASVPGAVECKPQGPQTGWWWNPLEAGRGYSIEKQGNNLFMAAYFYADDGRATWVVASGATSIDGSLFTAPSYACTSGVTLAGPFKPKNCTAGGNVTLAFNTDMRGTMVWPGGTVPLERFDTVGGGVAAGPQAGAPENGWWWNAAEDGRGFFIEWQAGSANIAGYMYDDAGNPIWYITVVATPNPLALNSAWWQYANGMTMAGPYKPAAQINNNVGPATIAFSSATTATLTLPGGRQIPLTRFRF